GALSTLYRIRYNVDYPEELEMPKFPEKMHL
ncbi:unnamed protein product, partial [marine sediment metagenome]